MDQQQRLLSSSLGGTGGRPSSGGVGEKPPPRCCLPVCTQQLWACSTCWVTLGTGLPRGALRNWRPVLWALSLPRATYHGHPSQLGSGPEILASPGKAIKGPSPASAAVGATRLSGRPGRWAWGSASRHLCVTRTSSSVQAPLTLPLPTVPAQLQQVWLMIQ